MEGDVKSRRRSIVGGCGSNVVRRKSCTMSWQMKRSLGTSTCDVHCNQELCEGMVRVRAAQLQGRVKKDWLDSFRRCSMLTRYCKSVNKHMLCFDILYPHFRDGLGMLHRGVFDYMLLAFEMAIFLVLAFIFFHRELGPFGVTGPWLPLFVSPSFLSTHFLSYGMPADDVNPQSSLLCFT